VLSGGGLCDGIVRAQGTVCVVMLNQQAGSKYSNRKIVNLFKRSRVQIPYRTFPLIWLPYYRKTTGSSSIPHDQTTYFDLIVSTFLLLLTDNMPNSDIVILA
jgi:hypothetical protein